MYQTYHVLDTAHRNSNIVGWLCNIIGIGALCTVPFVNPYTTPSAFTLALLAGLGGKTAFKSAVRTGRTLEDIEGVASQQLTNAVYQQLDPTPPAVPEPAPKPVPPGQDIKRFQWEWLNTRHADYPHLLVVGKSGSGKSTTAEWLCSLLGGITIAVAPHWEAGEFDTADYVVGGGRLYGTSFEEYSVSEGKDGSLKVVGDPPITDFLEMDDDARQRVMVTQFIRWLYEEMNARFQLDENGKRPVREFINVILDEVPSYSGLPGYKAVFRQLIREARKVHIRLIFLAQGVEVEALGFQGEGQLRMSLTPIMLGRFAIEHQRAIVRNNPKDPEQSLILEELLSAERPCLVDGMVADIPKLTKESLKPPETPIDTGVAKTWVLTVAKNKGAIKPSDVARYSRAAKRAGVNASVAFGLFEELEADGLGTIGEDGRFTLHPQE